MSSVPVSTFRAVCKLRWVQKTDSDYMVISNIEALKQAAAGVMAESKGDYQTGAAAFATAKGILDAELNQYLSGLKFSVPISPGPEWSMADLGNPC